MWPPLWSSSSNWKPPSVPTPASAGGRKGTTCAPGILARAARSLPTTAGAPSSRVSRCSIGSSRTKSMPRFGEAPPKLKPMTENTARIAGSFCNTASTCCPILEE